MSTSTILLKDSFNGVHVWLRYQSKFLLYALGINRRDNLQSRKRFLVDPLTVVLTTLSRLVKFLMLSGNRFGQLPRTIQTAMSPWLCG